MTKKSAKSYSELKQELDEILLRFETSAHEDVDDMLKDYEKATALIKELEAYLDKTAVSLKKVQK